MPTIQRDDDPASTRPGRGCAPTQGIGRRPLVRGSVGMLAVSVMVFNTLLMLSDRAPGALQRLWDLVDAGGASTGAHPASDVGVHLVVWATAAFLGALWARSTQQRLRVTAAIVVLSTIIELAQDHLTATRTTDLVDLAANLVGISIGLVGAIVVRALVDGERPAR